jgi:hypothetical protein
VKKKVLVTGMTAQQHSFAVANRSLSFAGSLAKCLERLEYEVHFAEPSVEWNSFFLSEYSKVFVGVAPALSVTSNSTYGALSTIATLADDQKLSLFIDGPEPWKIFANLRAIEKDGTRLIKPFYSRRKGYNAVVKSDARREHVLRGASILLNNDWPSTVYPRLPWADDTMSVPGIPANALKSMIGINTDSLSLTETAFKTNRVRRWITENDSTRWMKNTEASLTLPCSSIKKNKLRTDEDIFGALVTSLGALIGPHTDKTTWWSPTYVHALNAGTPIATDWISSSKIGDAWNHIAAGIEEMSQIDHYELSVTQKEQYISNIANEQDTLTHIQQLVGK